MKLTIAMVKGTGNRELGIGNSDALNQDRESTSKKTVAHNCKKCHIWSLGKRQ
ncbi:MAG: hypothetical protein F6K26_14630 [Moorea sp. SIO2I5]|nr:hypothetical protein [Moorena sp. SIO2I5]